MEKGTHGKSSISGLFSTPPWLFLGEEGSVPDSYIWEKSSCSHVLLQSRPERRKQVFCSGLCHSEKGRPCGGDERLPSCLCAEQERSPGFGLDTALAQGEAPQSAMPVLSSVKATFWLPNCTTHWSYSSVDQNRWGKRPVFCWTP